MKCVVSNTFLVLSIFAFCLSGQQLKANELIYVTNEKDNSISVVDAESLQVLRTIEVGERPRGLILSKDQQSAYICASDSDRIQILDLGTEQVSGELPSGEDPETIALHPNGTTLYTANEDDALLTVIDIPSKQVISQIEVGVEPEGLGVSPNGDLVVVTSETTNMAHWIDTQSNKVIHNTPVGQRPRAAVFNKEGTELWISSEIGGQLAVFDVKTKALKQQFQFNIQGVYQDRVQPVGVALTDNGQYAFIALGPANHVAVINRQNMQIERYLLVGRRVWQLGFNQDQSRLYTTNGVSGDVSVIDIEKLKVIRSVKVGRYPWGVVSRKTKAAP